MLNDPSISIATAIDIPELLVLVNSAYRGEAAKKGWTHEADLIAGEVRTDETTISKMLTTPGAVFLTCKDESDTLLGCVYLQNNNGRLYLGMFAVNPELQAKGIGKRLLNAATEYAAQEKCHSIYMTVVSLRQELIDWYERHGYRKTGETEPFPNDNRYGTPRKALEFVVLEKEIKS
jgi:ribosomal protein S18 acetylase RimI-like enzyme